MTEMTDEQLAELLIDACNDRSRSLIDDADQHFFREAAARLRQRAKDSARLQALDAELRDLGGRVMLEENDFGEIVLYGHRHYVIAGSVGACLDLIRKSAMALHGEQS